MKKYEVLINQNKGDANSFFHVEADECAVDDFRNLTFTKDGKIVARVNVCWVAVKEV